MHKMRLAAVDNKTSAQLQAATTELSCNVVVKLVCVKDCVVVAAEINPFVPH